MTDPLDFFVRLYRPHARTAWTESSVQSMAAAYQPEALLGAAWTVIKGDAITLWAQWFIASLLHPSQFVDAQEGQRVRLIRDIQGLVEARFPTSSSGRKDELVDVLVDLANVEIQRRQRNRRTSYDTPLRRDLLDRAGDPARCWICGHKFSQEALDLFADDSCDSEVALPLFVDVVRPAGMKSSDLRIEVDHVMPISDGGEEDENLRLACGWCNRAKSNHTNLYDVGSDTRLFRHSDLGVIDLPQPFWVVRVLALKRRCEHPSSPMCASSTTSEQLYVSPSHAGAMTPPNLACFCAEHDPWRKYRLVPRDMYLDGAKRQRGPLRQ